MSKTCYVPQKGIDDEIALRLGWKTRPDSAFTDHRVATLRGMYDGEHSKNPLDTSDLDAAARILAKYRRELKVRSHTGISSAGTNLAEVFKRFRRAFTSEERHNRTTMISGIFSSIVDNIQKANPSLSREAIIKGFYVDGEYCFGEFRIFEKVYDEMLHLQAAFTSRGKFEQAEKVKQVIDNWPSLVTYVRTQLRDTEGIKLGNTIEFADSTVETNFGDNDMEKLFNLDEAGREHFQKTHGMESAFGSIGQQVRRFISKLPLMELSETVNPITGKVDSKWVPKRDDLGYVQTMNPVKAHQTLSEFFRGATTAEEMMSALLENYTPGEDLTDAVIEKKAKQGWMIPIIKAFNGDPHLITQFFVDFRRNLQPYGIMFEDKANSKGGFQRYKTKLINRIEDLLGGAFMARAILGKPLNAENSVFDEKGHVVYSKLAEVFANIEAWLTEPKVKYEGVFDKTAQYAGNVHSKFYTSIRDGGPTRLEQRAFLFTTLEALGIDIDADTLDVILKDSKKTRTITKALKDLQTHGVGTGNMNALKAGVKMTYKSLITAPRASDRKRIYKENIDKINNVITSSREGLRLESRATRRDSKGNSVTLHSLVTPSFMGDRFDKIESYVKNNKKKELLDYLMQSYGKSSFFYHPESGRFLNKWLEELRQCCLSKAPLDETFASEFKYMRFLGTADIDFEDFTSKRHMISLLTEYRADKETNNKADTANYPVFVLGDSGVSKFIKARRYNTDELINGFYDVYKQERRRQEFVKAANDYLSDKEGKRGKAYKLIDNFSETEKVFSQLPFLNADYKAPDGSIGKYHKMLGENPSEMTVKHVISAYMDEAYSQFKMQLNNLGLLKSKTVTEYDSKGNANTVTRFIYLGADVNSENLDSVLKDFYMNTKFATIQQLQMMTIDPSFYTNTKDLQKRYKEIHAPGTLLHLLATDDDGNLYSEDGIERAVYFDDITSNPESFNEDFMEVIAKQYGKNSKIYKKYQESSLTDGQGYRTLKSYRKVMGMAGKWTPEMEKAYKAIQQLRQDYGSDINGKHAEIPADKIAEIAKLAVVFQPIKPYLFGHEELPVNEKNPLLNTLLIPVQHKYAEAVLIPELLPVGSKLRDMANWMDSNDIDLVGSTKIVKVGCFGSTDISSAKTYDDLTAALNNAYVHKLSYADYRIQTNVPEHINNSQLFGTQIRKLIMAGIKLAKRGFINETYRYESYVGGALTTSTEGDGKVNLGGNKGKVRLTGDNLIAFYNALIVANIQDSFKLFEEQMSKPGKLSDALIQSIINNSRESLDNILAYCLNEKGEFELPLFEAGLEHDAAALLLSIFRKLVNKQIIKGGSAVQASAMGIKGYEESGDLQYITDKNKENILYAECEMPFDISYIDAEGNEVFLEYERYCNADGTLKEIIINGEKTSLLEYEFPGSTSLIAYRIPTERDYSMINLKVKRFSPKTAGGVIKVPAQGTTIAGFDFDIDKLYFMRREYRAKKKQSTDKITDKLFSSMFGQDTSFLLEFEEYDFSKSPRENTRAARNNMLINLIQFRLEDPETLVQRTTPGGFANASKAARVMREILYGKLDGIVTDGIVNFKNLYDRAADRDSDPEPNYDPSDPMTLITYNQMNQVASKLIGIFANQNTNHAFSSLMKEFRLKHPIEFAGHSYGNGVNSDFLNAPKDVDVDLNVAEFLSASVDAVKDPVLNYMNLNTITADAGAVLARIGYTTEEIGILFNQPIIRELCEYCFNNNCGIDIAIKDIKEQYREAGVTIRDKNALFNTNNFSMDTLVKNILNDRVKKEEGQNVMDNKSYVERQIEILDLFDSIASISSEVSQFVLSTKFTASNAVGSTLGDLYAQQMKVQKYLSEFNSESSSINMVASDKFVEPIKNNEELLNMSDADYMDTILDNPLAYEQAMYDANRKALKLLLKYFPYDAPIYANSREILANLTRSGTLDAETINSIHSDVMVYLLSSQDRSEFNGDLSKNDTRHGEMTTREYYTKCFAQDLFEFIHNNPHMKEKPIFKYMLFDVNEETDELYANIQDVGGLQPFMKDEIKESWVELANNPETERIAIDLFMYNFYKLGFQFSPKAFMNLAPVEVKQKIQVPNFDGSSRTYVEFLREIANEDSTIGISSTYFARQYILNHLDNKRFGIEARKGSLAYKRIETSIFKTPGIAEKSFVLDISKSTEGDKVFILKKTENTRQFMPIIKVRTDAGELYYMPENLYATSKMSMTYHRVDKLGSKGTSLQYTGDLDETIPVETTPTFEDSSTSVNPLEDKAPITDEPLTDVMKEALIYEIANEMSKASAKYNVRDDAGELYTKEALAEGLREKAPDSEIRNLAESLRNAARQDGVVVLDSEGNPVPAC